MLNAPTRPAAVLRALVDQLQARLYGAACSRFGVLGVVHGLTVWTDGRELWWQPGDDAIHRPATDPDGAARELVKLAHD